MWANTFISGPSVPSYCDGVVTTQNDALWHQTEGRSNYLDQYFLSCIVLVALCSGSGEQDSGIEISRLDISDFSPVWHLCRHDMDTLCTYIILSNGNCGGFPAQMPVIQIFKVRLLFAWTSCYKTLTLTLRQCIVLRFILHYVFFPKGSVDNKHSLV